MTTKSGGVGSCTVGFREFFIQIGKEKGREATSLATKSGGLGSCIVQRCF